MNDFNYSGERLPSYSLKVKTLNDIELPKGTHMMFERGSINLSRIDTDRTVRASLQFWTPTAGTFKVSIALENGRQFSGSFQIIEQDKRRWQRIKTVLGEVNETD